MTENNTADTDREWPTETPTDAADGYPDTAIVPYVRALNTAGVETLQSCAGHIHPDGTRSDGVLWFDAPSVDVDELVGCEAIIYVRRMFKPEQCWEVVFPGLAHGESSLEQAMAAVKRSVGADDD